jgi:hypothetical protein
MRANQKTGNGTEQHLITINKIGKTIAVKNAFKFNSCSLRFAGKWMFIICFCVLCLAFSLFSGVCVLSVLSLLSVYVHFLKS